MVDLAFGGTVSENTGGVLEGSGGKPAVGIERSPDGTQDDVSSSSRIAPLGDDAFVGHFIAPSRNNVSREEAGVTWIIDPDLITHLTNDNLEMFVVDADALRFVNGLDFFNEIFLRSSDAFD